MGNLEKLISVLTKLGIDYTIDTDPSKEKLERIRKAIANKKY